MSEQPSKSSMFSELDNSMLNKGQARRGYLSQICIRQVGNKEIPPITKEMKKQGIIYSVIRLEIRIYSSRKINTKKLHLVQIHPLPNHRVNSTTLHPMEYTNQSQYLLSKFELS